jgi:ribosomal protein L11 methyltransferase
VELRADGEAVRYRVYFPDAAPLPIARRLRDLWHRHSGAVPVLAPFTEEERDWAAAGHRRFTGSEVGPFWIGPPWVEPPAGRRVVRVNPGRAFGTGLHPTTRLALRLLAPRVSPAARVLDVGTGSGVLALAALALGAADVLALDVDAHALGNARENAELNGSGRRVRLVAGSATCLAPGLHAFDPVLANLEHPILLPLLPLLVSALAPEGALVVSGVTAARRDAFREAATDEGLLLHAEDEEEGWWAAALVGR